MSENQISGHDRWPRKAIPKIIVFDFFGVISSEVAPFWLERYFSAEAAKCLKEHLVSSADRGEISDEQLFDALGDRAGVSSSLVESQWHEYVRIDGDVVDLVRELSSVFRVALLSNSPAAFLRHILTAHDLDTLFETIVISSEVGVAKPTRQIYEILLERTAVEPHQALLIDDNPANVAGAVRVGMQGLQFTTLPLCRRDLARLCDPAG